LSGSINVSCTGYPQKIEVTTTPNANQPTQFRVGRVVAGAVAQTIYIKGMNIAEAGSNAVHSPRAITDGSTKVAQTGLLSFPSFGLSPSQGTFLAVIRPDWRYNAGPGWDPCVFYYGDPADSSKYVFCYYHYTGSTFKWTLERKSAGSSTIVERIGRFYRNDLIKIACAWDATHIKLTTGSLPSTVVSNTNVPSSLKPSLQVGHLAGAVQLCGEVCWASVSPTYYNDADLDLLWGRAFKENAAAPPNIDTMPNNPTYAGGKYIGTEHEYTTLFSEVAV
jgi:hypothetical protein